MGWTMKKILICVLFLFCLTSCDKEDSKDYKKELIQYTSNLTNPHVSPQYMLPNMLEGFPNVYIQMGEKEIIINDTKKFCMLLRSAHVPFTLDIWPDMMHMFQFADEFLEESHLAIDKVGKFIKKNK